MKTAEVEHTFALRDLEKSSEANAHLQKERDTLLSQQQHWDDLRRTADHVETLSKLIAAAEDEELKELKRIRDRSATVEAEHSALRKRYDEQESKLATLLRTSSTNKQTMAQTQQRLAEWEKRARDKEADLETMRAQLEQEEEGKRALDVEVSELKAQLEDKDFDERSARVSPFHVLIDDFDLLTLHILRTASRSFVTKLLHLKASWARFALRSNKADLHQRTRISPRQPVDTRTAALRRAPRQPTPPGTDTPPTPTNLHRLPVLMAPLPLLIPPTTALCNLFGPRCMRQMDTRHPSA